MRTAGLTIFAVVAIGVAAIPPAHATTVFPCENPDRNYSVDVPRDRVPAFRTIVRGYAKGLDVLITEQPINSTLEVMIMPRRAEWAIFASSPNAGGNAGVGYIGDGPCERPLAAEDRARWEGLLTALRRGGFSPQPGVPWTH